MKYSQFKSLVMGGFAKDAAKNLSEKSGKEVTIRTVRKIRQHYQYNGNVWRECMERVSQLLDLTQDTP